MASKGTELGFDLSVCLFFSLSSSFFCFGGARKGRRGGEAWQVGMKSNVN